MVVLEREAQFGYHATGRSAATLVELETDPVMHELLAESAAFFRSAPSELGTRILDTSGVLLLYDAADFESISASAPDIRSRGTAIELLEPDQTRHRFPVLERSPFDAAAWLPAGGRLDVPTLLQTYLDLARTHGAIVRSGIEVTGILRDGDTCIGVKVGDRTIKANVVVNAAGAWAGQLARAAGVGLPVEPLRRTVVCFDPPPKFTPKSWPLISFESRKLYFGPENDLLLCCPMDELPSDPCDARADDDSVRATLARLAELVPPFADVEAVSTRAGLRTFAQDRKLLVGADPALEGFFWLAGQGGWGIETSPATARLAADLIIDGGSDWAHASTLSPARFR